MAQPTLGTATLRTRLDTSGLQQGFQRARSSSQGFFRGVSRDLDRLGSSLPALIGSGGLVFGLRSAAQEAQRAEASQRLFSRVVQRSGEDAGRAATLVGELSERFGVLPRAVEESVTLLLRQGASLQDVERALTSAGASAAATGFDLTTAFDNVATAVATGRSELLETSGIIANLGPVTQRYASSIGKTTEELTQQERIQARVNAIYEETRTEIEDVDAILQGLPLAQSRFTTALTETRAELGESVIPAYSQLLEVGTSVLGVVQATPEPLRAAGLAASAAAAGVTALAGAFTLLRGVLGVFAGPVGLFIAGAAGATALGTALLSAGDDAEEASSDFQDARDAIGAASDKDALAGVLEDLSKSLDGEAKRAMQDYAAEVRNAKGDVEDLKDEAVGLSEAFLAPLRAEQASLETQLSALRNLEQGTNDLAGARERLAGLSQQQQALREEGDFQTAAELELEMNMLRSTIRNGESTDQQAQYIVDRREALTERLNEINAQLAAATAGASSTGDGDDGDGATSPPPPGGSGDARTVADVFADLAEAGSQAERTAAAFGNTLEARLESVEDRASLVRGAIDDLMEMGLSATDDRVQFLVERFEELERRARVLTREPGLPGAVGRLQGAPGETGRVPTGTDTAAFLTDRGSGGLEQVVYRAQLEGMTRAMREGTTPPSNVVGRQPLGITDLLLDESGVASALVQRIVNQALIESSAALEGQRAQQQGGLGAPQSTEELEAFNQELRDTTEAEALAAGAMTDFEREVRAATAGARTFAEGLRQAEREQAVLDRIQRQGRLDASPNLQARLAQQQGAPGVEQSTEDLDDFNDQLAETTAAEAEAAGTMTDFEREARDATAGARSFAEGLRQAERNRVLTARIQRQQLIAGSPELQARLAQGQGEFGAPQSQEDRDAFQADVEALDARQQAEQDAADTTTRLTRTFNRLDTIASSRNLQIALSRGQGGPTPEGLAAEPEPMDPSVFDTAQTRLERGMSPDEFRDVQDAGAEVDREAAAAADRFASTVVESAFGFTDSLIGAIESGDVTQAFEGAISAASSVVGSADLGSMDFLGGSIGISSLVSGGIGILGSILGAAFSGDDQEEQRREEERRRSRNVPAININFQFDQINHYQGGPQMPQVEQAYRRQAVIAIEEFMNRTKLVQRVEALEG